jgi:hypothetical protein
LQGLLLVSGGFVAGAIFMTCLFVFSVMPGWAVPEKYKKNAASASPGTGSDDKSSNAVDLPVTPHGDLPIAEVPDENKWQVWLNDYKLRFLYEANRFDLAQNRRTNVLALKDTLPHGTTGFTWRLGVDSDHTPVLARGFRVTSTGLIYPLSNDEGIATHFKVPACMKGDTKVTVLVYDASNRLIGQDQTDPTGEYTVRFRRQPPSKYTTWILVNRMRSGIFQVGRITS